MNPLFFGVSVAEEMNAYRRNTMEDVHRIVPNFDNDVNKAFFAVYDGHGGRNVADFLETELEKNIAIELKVQDDASIPERLTRAYLITDLQLREQNVITSGATAVTCLLIRERDEIMLYTANVGDSRAVVCHNGSAIRLTYDHRAEDESEAERITSSGGFIIRNRVLGILAVSRSFGDHGMKQYVTGQPFTSSFNLKSRIENPFLILACDGVWDVIS